MARIVEVEVCNADNNALFFPPLQRRLRGRFDARQKPSLENGRLFAKWPDAIPGLHVQLDCEERVGRVREPLHDPENAALAGRIKQAGYSLPPAVEEFPLTPADLPTWCFWLQRALDSGLARVVAGEVPKVPGKPRTQFVTQEREDTRDKLLNRLTALLVAKLPPKEREAFEQTLDALEDD